MNEEMFNEWRSDLKTVRDTLILQGQSLATLTATLTSLNDKMELHNKITSNEIKMLALKVDKLEAQNNVGSAEIVKTVLFMGIGAIITYAINFIGKGM